MNVKEALRESDFGNKIIHEIETLPDGEGLTKGELSERFGFGSAAVAEKWCLRYPEVAKRRVYIPINNGRQRTAIFVNSHYKQQLITNGLATENY